MNDMPRGSNDPGWGQEGRAAKAEAIVCTLQILYPGVLPRGLWLDVGCGSGGIAAALAPFADQVIGVDPEPWERWQSYREQNPGVAFRVAGYRDLASLIGKESCDVVVCNQVYEHVDDPQALLQAIHAVLKPEGICYFAGPNLLWPIEPHVFWPVVHWLPRAFARGAMRFLGSRRADALDANSTHYWQLLRWFRQAGFVSSPVIAARIDGGWAARGANMRLPRLLAGVVDGLAWMSPGFVFVLRKARSSGTVR